VPPLERLASPESSCDSLIATLTYVSEWGAEMISRYDPDI